MDLNSQNFLKMENQNQIQGAILPHVNTTKGSVVQVKVTNIESLRSPSFFFNKRVLKDYYIVLIPFFF